MKNYAILFLKLALFGSFCFFTYLMVLITLQYVPLNFDVSFLALKDEKDLSHYQISFFTHIYSAIFVLILGIFQFSSSLRAKWPALHRGTGKLYILLVLFLAAPSGLVMGYYGNGGIYSQVSFVLQAVLWFVFTLRAFIEVRKRNYVLHRNFMILSYAMTLSAISLRLCKWIIANTLELPPMDTYKIVVWLGWTLNLAVAFLIIRYSDKNTKPAKVD